MFDFCINGAGMIGAATALGLVRLGYRVALIEPHMPSSFSSEQSPDLRMSAISLGSSELLSSLGAWQFIKNMRMKPYSRLSVWEDPKFASHFDAADIGKEYLGYFIENRIVQLGLHQALSEYEGVTWISDDKISSINQNKLGADVVLSNGDIIQTKWIIGAEGANSPVRELAKIGTTGWEYSQHALSIIIEADHAISGKTWQQFTPTGPRALLPMHDNFASLIWYDTSSKIKSLMSLSYNQLHKEVIQHFPALIPTSFSIKATGAFPLARKHANSYVKGRCILIGDAAHTINPLAGQGVNLGFKDVACFLDVIKGTSNNTFNTLELETKYQAVRMRDNLLMMSAMDGFYHLFSNDNPLVKILRNSTLGIAEHSGLAKKQALKYAVGI